MEVDVLDVAAVGAPVRVPAAIRDDEVDELVERSVLCISASANPCAISSRVKENLREWLLVT